MENIKLNITKSGFLGSPRGQKCLGSSLCWCPSALLWKGCDSAEKDCGYAEKKDQMMPWTKIHQSLLTTESHYFRWAIPDLRSGGAGSIPRKADSISSPFLCPFLASFSSRAAGWMDAWLCSLQSSLLWTSKVKIARDLWLCSHKCLWDGKSFQLLPAWGQSSASDHEVEGSTSHINQALQFCSLFFSLPRLWFFLASNEAQVSGRKACQGWQGNVLLISPLEGRFGTF